MQSGTVFAAAKDKDSGNIDKSEEIAFDSKKAAGAAIVGAIGENQLKVQISPEKFDPEKYKSISGSDVVSNKESPKKGAKAEKSRAIYKTVKELCVLPRKVQKKMKILMLGFYSVFYFLYCFCLLD